ncbi:hypothetical protein ACFUIW_08940 [Streptomyces sp. NPDC057245]|uniref:hypothetical protein n=1 Tax=Streptomyces TaxID=1883 RepID=UPI001C1E8C7C|nr:hypothetical protein [Streptomyces sp. A108]MBU6534596.1 hypothetical protein [Streptomyces sp. A108]
MGQIAASQENATRNGINALEQAFSGIQRSRQDVENTKMDTGLGGAVGKDYWNLLQTWDEHAENISRSLRSMIEELNETLRSSGLTEGSSRESVNQEFHRSESVFNALNSN